MCWAHTVHLSSLVAIKKGSCSIFVHLLDWFLHQKVVNCSNSAGAVSNYKKMYKCVLIFWGCFSTPKHLLVYGLAEGTGGDAASKTLASRYEAVLQKTGLELCIEFSVRLQKIRYGSGFTTQILAIISTQDHSRSSYYCSSR